MSLRELPFLESASPLVCPESKQRLYWCRLERYEAALTCPECFQPVRSEGEPPPIGRTQVVLLREDERRAYPVVSGCPVLMIPEMLAPKWADQAVDWEAAHYGALYRDLEFYSRVAYESAHKLNSSTVEKMIFPVRPPSPLDKASFPLPAVVWIDDVYDWASQLDAYQHLSPLNGKLVLQIGGQGWHAVKFLLAGAKQAWLLTPFLAEAESGRATARFFNVTDRFKCVVGVAEDLPFADDSMDAVYSGGCVHHTLTEMAAPEIARVIAPGGGFAAVDPWKALFHSLGTRIFGKREEAVNCRPLDRRRMSPFFAAFQEIQVIHHGTITRYPMLAFDKMGIHTTLPAAMILTKVDDWLCSLAPYLRNQGSCVAILARKP
jgi:uncharacterized protein YbaR (Trm112 family)/SAM-dependent methyltransferase